MTLPYRGWLMTEQSFEKGRAVKALPLLGYFLYSIRMEFSTHSMATPESANTASHMLA